MRTATAKKQKAPMPKWFKDFLALLEEVVRENKKEIRAQLDEWEKSYKKIAGALPDPAFDDALHVLFVVGAWVVRDGTDEQRRVLRTWIENTKALQDKKAA